MIDLRKGRWQDVLADVGRVDAVITDPPFSDRVHDGAAGVAAHGTTVGVDDYDAMDETACAEFATHWHNRCDGWIVIHTDDVIGPLFRDVLDGLGRMTFPLVPVLQRMPRVSGDGPGSPGHFLVVSRPRAKRFLSWGSLPCWYEAPRASAEIVRGAKPLGLMRAIVRDYSRPGDLICDPCAGGATTLIAAASEGRRAVGAEMDPDTYAKAQARIARGWTPDMFTSTP